MNSDYRDIIAAVGRAPEWWDDNGVPRFAPFHPSLSPSIYAHEVVLLEIACQACDQRFLVSLNSGIGRFQLLSPQVPDGIDYGDPPNTGCCAAGPTMSSVAIRVVEFWDRPTLGEWKRVPSLEVALEPRW